MRILEPVVIIERVQLRSAAIGRLQLQRSVMGGGAHRRLQAAANRHAARDVVGQTFVHPDEPAARAGPTTPSRAADSRSIRNARACSDRWHRRGRSADCIGCSAAPRTPPRFPPPCTRSASPRRAGPRGSRRIRRKSPSTRTTGLPGERCAGFSPRSAASPELHRVRRRLMRQRERGIVFPSGGQADARDKRIAIVRQGRRVEHHQPQLTTS